MNNGAATMLAEGVVHHAPEQLRLSKLQWRILENYLKRVFLSTNIKRSMDENSDSVEIYWDAVWG